jgi:hypothetical protein
MTEENLYALAGEQDITKELNQIARHERPSKFQ